MDDKNANYPRVIQFGYKDFTTKDRTVSAGCKFCREKTVISDRVGTTSNFVKHLERKHPERCVSTFADFGCL